MIMEYVTLNNGVKMEENLNVFDFSLADAEMSQIEALDSAESLFFSHYDPQTVEWILSMS